MAVCTERKKTLTFERRDTDTQNNQNALVGSFFFVMQINYKVMSRMPVTLTNHFYLKCLLTYMYNIFTNTINIFLLQVSFTVKCSP